MLDLLGYIDRSDRDLDRRYFLKGFSGLEAEKEERADGWE